MVSIPIRQLSTAAVIAAAVSLLTTREAFAYTFTQIADGNALNSFFLSTEAINDSGTVGFSSVSADFSSSTVFTGSGGALTPLVDTSGFLELVESYDINNNGTVLFFAERDDGSIGLFTSSGGPITTIADDSGSFSSFGPFGVPVESTINDSGTVAFAANLDAGGQGIFIGSGGVITPIADDSGIFSSFSSDAFINNSGTVTFTANLDAGGQGIFTNSGGVLTTIVDTSGSFESLGGPAANDSGMLAFTAFPDAGGLGIFTASGGVITPIADDSGIFRGFNSPAINNSGTVAFLASLDDLSSGIFTGSNPIADKVIATGDTLFGRTVEDISFFNRGLNNSNQISFFARFDDGSEGIFRANPVASTPVPEPTSVLGSLTAGTLGIIFIRRKQRTV